MNEGVWSARVGNTEDVRSLDRDCCVDLQQKMLEADDALNAAAAPHVDLSQDMMCPGMASAASGSLEVKGVLLESVSAPEGKNEEPPDDADLEKEKTTYSQSRQRREKVERPKLTPPVGFEIDASDGTGQTLIPMSPAAVAAKGEPLDDAFRFPDSKAPFPVDEEPSFWSNPLTVIRRRISHE